ncbi:hypothetical protein EfmGK961_10430 [Enterococcus faecium]|nr:hypothetical protein EfmGK961_10430 [Enterococcus faecium]
MNLLLSIAQLAKLEGTIMNILMIEDNQSVSEMMQMFFLNEGWEATFKYEEKEGR